jgi:DNA-binding NtrC family response regulator
MSEWILVVGGDKRTCFKLVDLLSANDYRAVCSFTLLEIEAMLQEAGCRLVIFDLDTVPLDNRTLKEFKKFHGDLSILALSERSFHPELKESMANHIYACLSKPVDADELIYCVNSIFCNAWNHKDNPAQDEWETFRKRRPGNHQSGGTRRATNEQT